MKTLTDLAPGCLARKLCSNEWKAIICIKSVSNLMVLKFTTQKAYYCITWEKHFCTLLVFRKGHMSFKCRQVHNFIKDTQRFVLTFMSRPITDKIEEKLYVQSWITRPKIDKLYWKAWACYRPRMGEPRQGKVRTSLVTAAGGGPDAFKFPFCWPVRDNWSALVYASTWTTWKLEKCLSSEPTFCVKHFVRDAENQINNKKMSKKST